MSLFSLRRRLEKRFRAMFFKTRMMIQYNIVTKSEGQLFVYFDNDFLFYFSFWWYALDAALVYDDVIFSYAHDFTFLL